MNPVSHYALIFTRLSDGSKYGATDIGNVTTYTIHNLSGQDAYTFEVLGVNGCAPGPRGSVTSKRIAGPTISSRPQGPSNQVLGVSTQTPDEVPSPSPSPSLLPSPSPVPSPTPNPSVLGASDCANNPWWWVPIVVYIISLLLLAIFMSGNGMMRRLINIIVGAISVWLMYQWICSPWVWIAAAVIAGIVGEVLTSFFMSEEKTH